MSATRGSCRYCNRQIIWATYPSGKVTPVDPEPCPEGTVVLRRRKTTDDAGKPQVVIMARIVARGVDLAPGEKRRTPHHATCTKYPR